MPAHKKDPSTRARRNKASTATTLLRVTTAETNVEDYQSLTVAQLRNEIDRRNEDGRSADQLLSRTGRKSELVERLVGDDTPAPDVPEMPPPPATVKGEGYWHSRTVEWWTDIWSSPMAPEWDDSDIHNVYVLAALYNDIWVATSAKARKEAATEYRLQRKDLGLTPYDRRRLEWTIEVAAEATERGKQRRGGSPNGSGKTGKPTTQRQDPRAQLHGTS